MDNINVSVRDEERAAMLKQISDLQTELLKLNLAISEAISKREHVRHIKRGSTYRVLGKGKIQVSGNPLVDYAEVVVYASDETGDIWIRPIDEFEDGRFEKIASEAN
jgi:hypothetical protein